MHKETLRQHHVAYCYRAIEVDCSNWPLASIRMAARWRAWLADRGVAVNRVPRSIVRIMELQHACGGLEIEIVVRKARLKVDLWPPAEEHARARFHEVLKADAREWDRETLRNQHVMMSGICYTAEWPCRNCGATRLPQGREVADRAGNVPALQSSAPQERA